MNQIGFENFRKFQKLEPLEYRGITFLVGRNNAGKSTLVKALLLVDNYFKSGNIDTLSFGNHVLEDANIVTYGRAKYYQAQENCIKFTQTIGGYTFGLLVSGEHDKTFARVLHLGITDLQKKFNFQFDLQARSITIIGGRQLQESSIDQSTITNIRAQLASVEKQLAEPGLKKTSKEYIELRETLESLLEKIELAESNAPVDEDYILFELEEDFGDATSLKEIVEGFLLRMTNEYEREFINVQQGMEPSPRFDDLRALNEVRSTAVESSFSHFMTLMNDFSIAYMGASPTRQSALFAIRDKNNALAQAIHEYKQLNILEGEAEHRFVLRWMKEFEVGDNFAISMHAGEAYEMKIHSHDMQIHLADKGMGSMQAMLLIMRMACVIRKIKTAKANSTIRHMTDSRLADEESSPYRLTEKTTVLIEEPELNLHPALQSKMADLLLDVHSNFNIDFLIETHSEYALRRSQVIVAEKEFEVSPNENPFCVYYFPQEGEEQPYRLLYQQDGSFDRNFGTGFFDTASLDTLNLLRIKREKEA